MYLKAAIKYMKDVLGHKRCVPFTRYRNHTGRTAQAKEFGFTQGINEWNAQEVTPSLGRWPEKSVKLILSLLQNIQANAAVRYLQKIIE